MAAVLNLDMECVSRLEMYEDDSVEAWFKDGTRTRLTACGSTFTRQEKAKTGPDPFGRLSSAPTSTTVQFTAFASRESRERVCMLLTFRNHFAEQPFLPDTLLNKEIKVSESAIDYAVWPSNLQQAMRANLLKTSLTGETCLQSSDGCAWVELATHGQLLTVCHLARLSRGDRLTSSSGALERNGSELTRPELHTTDDREQESESVCHHRYVWRKEMHSTERAPQNWAHPLCLLMQHRSHDTHTTHSTAPDKENERLDAVVSTPLPPTLPLSCFHPTLHHVQHQALRVKVLFTEEVIYRVFFDHQQRPFVEALPNQNTVLRSHDPDGRFFRCWSSNEDERGRVTESMYCVDHTPLASGLNPFSVARVIGQASRLLHRTRKLGKSNSKLCWKAPSPLPSPPSSPLHSTVPGLGRFTVRANGHVRCVFTDRTIVDFFNYVSLATDTPGPNPACARLKFNSPPEVGREEVWRRSGVEVGRGRGVEVSRGVWVDRNWCRLLQPNGRYLILSTHHPTSHQRYVEIVRDWCEWLAKPEDRRGEFYQRTIYDQHTQREVLAELYKIERFNAIMTNQLPCSSQQISGCGQIIGGCGQLEPLSFVQDALCRTETIVQDIDTILGK